MNCASTKVLFLVFLFATACHSAPPPKADPKPAPAAPVQKIVSDSDLLKQAADTVFRVLEEKDFDQLAQHVHPVEGLTFSPYGYVNSERAVRMKAEELQPRFTADTARVLLWGFYDGSGDSMRLTPKAYARRFVYDVDFSASDSMYYGKTPQRGNTLNNLAYAFPDGMVVESFVPGKTDMDWRALRLVFEKYNDRFYLVAIVHDQWTI